MGSIYDPFVNSVTAGNVDTSSCNPQCYHQRIGRRRSPTLAFFFVIGLLLNIVTAKNVPVPTAQQEQVHLDLRNDSPCTIEVYWINPENRDVVRMSKPTLTPGESLGLDTYEGHKFEVRNAIGKCCGKNPENCKRLNSFTMTSKPTQVVFVMDGLDFEVDDTTKGFRKTGRNGLTRHAQMCNQTLIDLHDMNLEENKGLDLGVDDALEAAKQVVERIGANLTNRIAKVFEKAKTKECRAMIGEHFSYFINAIGTEMSLPFADVSFENQCNETKYDVDNLPPDMHFGHIQNRTYQPEDAEYIDEAANLKLCYAILTHDDAAATIRLMEALYEKGHVFVVHVDGKESSDEVHDAIVEYASSRDYVHVLQHPYRVRVNWGGFTMVNATLQLLKYALAVDQDQNSEPLEFHKLVHIASTSYPIASNTEIRRRIASYPLDANMMHVIMKPSSIHPHSWHYFVECDDAVHRIYRLEPMSEKHGSIDLYTSSQWFIISREFAKYLAEALPGTLVYDYLQYVQHVVVADETFFGTILRNTVFCHKHHNWNFLHLQFDRWESELKQGKRDERKCLMPSPDHCGRSPTTMTVDYMDVLELSEDLFARKFLDSADSEIKDVLDMKREREDKLLRDGQDPSSLRDKDSDHGFAGHGVLIVAKETVHDDMPLCLGLGEVKNKLRLVPCFHDWVPKTLAPGWETGAVIQEETMLHNRWDLGPCSSDGSLERTSTGEMNMTPGVYSPVGPRCMLKQMDGIRAGRCLDGESERTQPGGDLQVFPCIRRWHQFVSFGNGTLVPSGSMHTTIPKYIWKRIVESGKRQEPYLCLGVHGRGDLDEEEWDKDKTSDSDENSVESQPSATKAGNELEPLSEWNGEQVITTRCSNVGAVIEWLYVPYILEEDDPDQNEADSSRAVDREL